MKTTMLLLLLVALLVAPSVLAANGLDIPRQLISSGGGAAQEGDFALQDSIGQAVVGGAESNSFYIRSGFWLGMMRHHNIFLPLITGSTP
jgi:hypothetical protein